MRSLKQIRNDYEHFDMLKEPQRTDSLVVLMGELERDHETFIINPNADELEQEAVILYREISSARKFAE